MVKTRVVTILVVAITDLLSSCTPGPFTTARDRERIAVANQAIAVAQRAMIQHVGGVPDDFMVTVDATGDPVDAWITDSRPKTPAKRAHAHCIISRKTLKVIKFELDP
jgi:organic hydroperoxide reductase OsmC/OhrA